MIELVPLWKEISLLQHKTYECWTSVIIRYALNYILRISSPFNCKHHWINFYLSMFLPVVHECSLHINLLAFFPFTLRKFSRKFIYSCAIFCLTWLNRQFWRACDKHAKLSPNVVTECRREIQRKEREIFTLSERNLSIEWPVVLYPKYHLNRTTKMFTSLVWTQIKVGLFRGL